MQTTVSDLLIEDFPRLTLNMTCKQAAAELAITEYKYLPVVDGNKLEGVLSIQKVQNHMQGKRLKELNYLLESDEVLRLLPQLPIIQACQLICQTVKDAEEIDEVPALAFVVDEKGEFCGAVRHSDIFAAQAQLMGANEEGAILGIALNAIDFSLTRIVNIVEDSGAKILSLSTDRSESFSITILLKLNTLDCYAVEQSLLRHGYNVFRLSPIAPSPAADTSLEARNYAGLMRYLGV